MSAPSTGFVGLWWCLCTDAADHPAWIPQTCPGHGKRLTGPPIENTEPGPTALGHRCGYNPCPERGDHAMTSHPEPTTTEEPA